MRKIIYTVSFLLIISIYHIQAKKLSKVDISSLYDENKFTTFETVVYHTSDEESTVYLNIRLHDMHYALNNSDSIHIAKFKVFYELYESYDSKSPIDTSSMVFIDSENFGSETEMIIDFDVKAKFPGEYVLKITLFDLQRTKDYNVFNFVHISKTNKNSAQYYFVTDGNNYPIFGRVVKPGQRFKIVHNTLDTGKMFVRYYDREIPLAKPPFTTDYNITFKFDPDSLYTISFTGGVSDLIELSRKGIYHIQADVGQVQGLTLFSFSDGFPEITRPIQAIIPLRYLTTQKEYDKLVNYYDFKVAVDSFWLERASQQPGRAKNMIARYYTRVEEANQMFTSYREGWKTDRGLIYIIYGPPSEVYRKTDEEEWIFGERGNPMSIKFYFPKVDNPFTDNDYSLHRSTIYKTSWYVAIDNWRR